MNTELLHEFCVFARRLNFTTAARYLNISQPTLSRHIAELERHFKTSLVTHGTATPELTYAGEVLLNSANKLLDEEQNLERELADARTVTISRLRIEDWRYSHTAMDVIHHALGVATAGFPGRRAEFVRAPAGATIVESLLRGDLDVGVLAHTTIGEPTYTEPEGIGVLPITMSRTHLHFFLDANNPLVTHKAISFADLKELPFAVPLIPECINIPDDLAAICRSFGYKPTIRYQPQLASIDDIYSMDLGCSVLIGIKEYEARGFASAGRIKMIPCADDIYVIIYIIFRQNDLQYKDCNFLSDFLHEVEAQNIETDPAISHA
ncbi:LysR family transcriptional regulator [bacterium]|nr:LysR family transcriptional regulator [bacterium]